MAKYRNISENANNRNRGEKLKIINGVMK